MSRWWTYHPCDVCRMLRPLTELRSVGDGRVICRDRFGVGDHDVEPDPEWMHK